MELLKRLTLFSIAGVILTASLWYGSPITPPPGFNETHPSRLFLELHMFIWLFFSVSLVLMMCKKINLPVFLSLIIGLIVVPTGNILEIIRVGEANNLLSFGHSLPDWLAGIAYYFINELRLKLIGYGLVAMLIHYLISVLTSHSPKKTVSFYIAFSIIVFISIWYWQFRSWGVSIYYLGIFLFTACISVMILWLDKNKYINKENI